MNGSSWSAWLQSSIQRPIIGYYLLWRDDVHGAWIPFTKATDEEIVWVGYDSTQRAHRRVDVLARARSSTPTGANRGTVPIDVQWGKHGSMPRGIRTKNAMWPRTLSNFWVSSWVGPARHLARAPHATGPLCFCHGYRAVSDVRPAGYHRREDRRHLRALRIRIRCSALFSVGRTRRSRRGLERRAQAPSRDVDDVAFGVDAHLLMETAHAADSDGVPHLVELGLVCRALTASRPAS